MGNEAASRGKAAARQLAADLSLRRRPRCSCRASSATRSSAFASWGCSPGSSAGCQPASQTSDVMAPHLEQRGGVAADQDHALVLLLEPGNFGLGLQKAGPPPITRRRAQGSFEFRHAASARRATSSAPQWYCSRSRESTYASGPPVVLERQGAPEPDSGSGRKLLISGSLDGAP